MRIISHGEIHRELYHKIIIRALPTFLDPVNASYSQKPLKRRINVTTIKCGRASTNRGAGKWLIIISIIERAIERGEEGWTDAAAVGGGGRALAR